MCVRMQAYEREVERKLRKISQTVLLYNCRQINTWPQHWQENPIRGLKAGGTASALTANTHTFKPRRTVNCSGIMFPPLSSSKHCITVKILCSFHQESRALVLKDGLSSLRNIICSFFVLKKRQDIVTGKFWIRRHKATFFCGVLSHFSCFASTGQMRCVMCPRTCLINTRMQNNLKGAQGGRGVGAWCPSIFLTSPNPIPRGLTEFNPQH